MLNQLIDRSTRKYLGEGVEEGVEAGEGGLAEGEAVVHLFV